jgi:hypothetical protein
MSRSTVTVDLSPDVYIELLERARRRQRGVEEEASLALAAAVRASSVLPDDLETALDTLDNDTLRRVSYSQPSVDDGILLAALVEKRRRDGLNPLEERWLVELGERHDRVMVLRAKAVALLHGRGVDVAERIARA